MSELDNTKDNEIIETNDDFENDEFVKNKIAFIERYKTASNTANATIDDNSNVFNKNIAIINSEIHKKDNTRISRAMVISKLKELYPNFNAKRYIRDLEDHVIYKHDESSFAGAIAPYTYSSKEVVYVKYNDKPYLVPFDLLYNEIVTEQEQLVDEDNVVYQKYPENLYVYDDNGKWSQVTCLTKKKRHRDLVRIKTSFGEDLIVTDNHPMIVNKDNINNTVNAIDSVNQKQYKIDTKFEFENISTVDLALCLYKGEVFNSYILYNKQPIKRYINVDRDFGYFIGFFIGDGNYANTDKYINFTQKDVSVLYRLNDILYNHFGIVGNIIYRSDNSNCYNLFIKNQALYSLLKSYFLICDKAQGKTLPANIFSFNEEFALGILEGLLDSDGTVYNNSIYYKLSSRAGILQVSALLKYFGYSVKNIYQQVPFGQNTSYKTNYSVWGVSTTYKSDLPVLFNSFKFKNVKICNNALRYKPNGETTIFSVTKLDNNDSFVSLQNEFIYDITTETRTFALNNILVHNCTSVTMYPFLMDGIKGLGGLSASPKNLKSFCGIFCNMIFAISSQFAGAVAVSEALLYFTYFCKKEWGDDFYKRPDEIIERPCNGEPRTILKEIQQYWQQIIYTINQPAAARGFQSAFVNFSYFDKPFFEGMFGEFYFPDGTKPDWESLSWVQKEFMKWFNAERLKTILTFPVETVTLLYKDGKFLDEDMYNFVCDEYERGHSFFTYISDTVDSLSSCCRLKNKLQTKEFNFTNGNIGIQTGSKSVITFNLNRIVQLWYRKECERQDDKFEFDETYYTSLKKYLTKIIDRVYKYHHAYNELLWDMHDAGLLPTYKAGFINLNKQYLTLGINGLNQAAEFLGMKCNDNPKYSQFCQEIFSLFKEQNELHKDTNHKHDLIFNTEQVPAESLGVKNYNFDKQDGFWVPDDTNLYASYIFKPNDPTVSVLEKIRMHGKNYIGEYLDGGAACHLNLDSHLSSKQYKHILEYAAKNGCNYLTFNIPMTECDECGKIVNQPLKECPSCGSKSLTYYSRIIGYLTAVKNWSDARQKEFTTRIHHHIKDDNINECDECGKIVNQPLKECHHAVVSH